MKQKWLVHRRGPIEICSRGLHASCRPWHALQYAPDPMLCRVEYDNIPDDVMDAIAAEIGRLIDAGEIE